MKTATITFKERILGWTGSLSGVTSILGSWQVCHNVCLAIIAVLAVLGITVTGMPLLFLTKIAVPVWIIAVILLMATFMLYYFKKCFSPYLLMLNSGLIIAGLPFSATSSLQPLWWIVGGSLALAGLVLFLKERHQQRWHS